MNVGPILFILILKLEVAYTDFQSIALEHLLIYLQSSEHWNPSNSSNTCWAHQCAFLKGCSIVDCFICDDEVVNQCKNKEEEMIMIKMNYEKTFGMVKWGTLPQVLFCRVSLGSRYLGSCRFSLQLMVQ